MQKINQPGFLRDKLFQINAAMLQCQDEQLFDVQSAEVKTLALDEDNMLWICMAKPVQCQSAGKESFDIVLNYYNAETPVKIDILGEAWMVSQHEGVSPAVQKQLERGRVVLKVKLIDVDCWEHTPPVLKSVANKLRYMFSGHRSTDKSIYPGHRVSA